MIQEIITEFEDKVITQVVAAIKNLEGNNIDNAVRQKEPFLRELRAYGRRHPEMTGESFSDLEERAKRIDWSDLRYVTGLIDECDTYISEYKK
ncbi:MAG: hypothetical protein ABIJ08_00665 [Nanoarchaeota archaeon]